MGQNRGKQSNLSKREALSRMIRDKKTAREIAMALGMNPTSVSREILRNRRQSASPLDEGTPCQKCENRVGCSLHHICGRQECHQKCASCKAIRSCARFIPFSCEINKRWPLCCNGCPKERRCPLEHCRYLPDEADFSSRERLRESRSGADMTPDELKAMDAALHEAVIGKGQSIHHALLANKDVIRCGEKTVYRRIAKGSLSVKNIDLPRRPGLKKRKRSSMADKCAYKHSSSIDRTGHLYSDWAIYRYANGITYYFETDLLGKPNASSKEVLVLTMPGTSFTLLYLVEEAARDKAKSLFDMVEKEIGTPLFKKIFPALLTDRDVVFDDFSLIETNDDGEIRTRVFFCNPAAPSQKANVESMNAQLRPVFPKRAILNEYTQKELCEAASMMNSRMLNSIDDKTPYELFAAIFGVGAAEALRIRKIAPKEVTLKPIHK